MTLELISSEKIEMDKKANFSQRLVNVKKRGTS